MLQRESFDRCGIDIPHVAVVDHEDLSAFRDMPFQKGLTLVSTREVLSRTLEDRRRVYRLRRRNPEWWQRRLSGPGVHGWGVQQVIKLASPRVTDSEVIVCMDCDTLFAGPVAGKDFYAEDGRPCLYETTTEIDAEMASWPNAAMRFLGVKPTGKALYRYTHSPVVFRREVLTDLHRHIAERHGRPWDTAFIDGGVTEYAVYGVYAREVDQLRRVAPIGPELSCYFWWPAEVARIHEQLESRLRQTNARILGIQSNTGVSVSELRDLLTPWWDQHQVEPVELRSAQMQRSLVRDR